MEGAQIKKIYSVITPKMALAIANIGIQILFFELFVGCRNTSEETLEDKNVIYGSFYAKYFATIALKTTTTNE